MVARVHVVYMFRILRVHRAFRFAAYKPPTAEWRVVTEEVAFGRGNEG